MKVNKNKQMKEKDNDMKKKAGQQKEMEYMLQNVTQ